MRDIEMETGGLINLLLVSLCSNFHIQTGLSEDGAFECVLKTEEQLQKDILRGKKLKIVTYDDFPLSMSEENESGTLKGTGITFEIVDTLQEKYGFKYELMKAQVRSIGDNKSGILGLVASGKADMVAGFLPILPGTHAYVSWGTQLSQNIYHIMMKRPQESASGNGLLAPFDTVVWLLILVSVVLVGPIMYGVIWLRVKFSEDPSLIIFPLPSCVWFVYGALMKQGSTLNPVTDSSRIMFATWWIFILILTAFYTANLTAFLTWSLFTLPIKTIDDVAKAPVRWFSASGGSVEYSITNKDDGDLDVLTTSVEKGYGKFLDTISAPNILRMVSEGWLYMDDSNTLTRLMFDEYKKKTKKGVEESKRCTYVLTEGSFLKRSLGFAYPKESNLPDLFNPVVQNFVESGILKHLASEGLPVSPICPLTLDSKERRLRNSDLLTTYIVVISGFTCAFAIFCAEILWRRCVIKTVHVTGTAGKSNVNQNPSNIGIAAYAAIKTRMHKNIKGRDKRLLGIEPLQHFCINMDKKQYV